jgi:hypothetical protein
MDANYKVKCTTCKKEYPKTKEYFFEKTSKQKLASGKIAVYKGFRSSCKKCHGIKGENRRIKKRCQELNCDIKDYRKNWKQQYSETRTVDLDAKEKLTEGQYNHYMDLYNKNEVKDYVDYLYRVEAKKRTLSKNKIKITSYKEIQNYRNKYYLKDRKKLKDAYIANNILGFKVGEIPKQVLETKRLIIKLKREVNYES